MPVNKGRATLLSFLGPLGFSSTSQPSRPDRPGPDHRPRLYCFPYAGGSASVFASWARALSPQIVVIGVEMPGHGARFEELPLEKVEDMAAEAAAAIAAAGNEGPFAFYGHSLGAIVAFETVRLLQASTLEVPAAGAPMHLLVGATRAPHLPRIVPPISHLPKQEFLDAVQQRYGGLPAVLFEEPELLELVLPALRADFKAYEAYKYASSDQVQCPISAFHGTKDEVVRAAAVGEWSRATDGSFALQTVEGDHFFLNTNREPMLARIRQAFADYGRGANRFDLTTGLSTVNR
jgi:medium-chain acyl-[acyl-carrier-protein] hydrolase